MMLWRGGGGGGEGGYLRVRSDSSRGGVLLTQFSQLNDKATSEVYKLNLE
jgi:hypothetical protein